MEIEAQNQTKYLEFSMKESNSSFVLRLMIFSSLSQVHCWGFTHEKGDRLAVLDVRFGLLLVHMFGGVDTALYIQNHTRIIK